MKRSRLHQQIEELIVSLAPEPEVRSSFEARLARGRLTHAEDPIDHFDVWYLLPTDGAGLVWDGGEFHAVRWVGLQEAKALAGDADCLRAFEVVGRRFPPRGGRD